ncbi:DUF4062 domain-containing protein [Pseudomonas coronafaciens]|uniref:DUF4062 domain-containing protein n=1 Tax=Pseudomonas coronafaciens TaxID=53409 RepID=UPI000F001459|nr:DUF4062 domain-containing protein [Pseudomonas coronafaciens]
MKKKYQVFISSTYIDLAIEREAIAKAVIDMGFIPSGMESFPATSMDQLRYIYKVIDDCDYYVLVIGARYGSLNEEGVSFTEKEYDYAVEQGKTVLAFIHSEPGNFPQRVADKNTELSEKLESFKAKASSGRIVKFWTSTDNLTLHTMTSLHHAADDYPGIGWVRGDFKDDADTTLAVREHQVSLWRLQHELTDLTTKATNLSNSVEAMFMSQTKPATDLEIELWKTGAKDNYPQLPEFQTVFRNIRYADKDFILPELFGTTASTVIVEKGVRVFKSGTSGHSTILYMDGFRMEGV